MSLPPPDIDTDTDTLIVGAGPAGLFAVFELGLRGIRAQLVDALPEAGGQCVSLYADQPIYDIPALPSCTGRELTDRLLEQIRPFAPTLHSNQLVQTLETAPGPEPGWVVGTSGGLRIGCRAVLLAGGVGAFMPRTLKLPGLERFTGTQLLYRAEADGRLAGQRVVIAGATEQALALANALALQSLQKDPRAPAELTLLHRREVFDAPPALIAEIEARKAQGGLRFVAAQPTGFDIGLGTADGAQGERLAALRLLGADGANHTLPLDRLVVLQGLSPQLGPLAGWGLALERRQVQVDPADFSTSQPGIFAIGDAVAYPGKLRLILSAFHEATLAAAGIATRLFPEHAGPLEYTTSSPRLHKLLGKPSGNPQKID